MVKKVNIIIPAIKLDYELLKCLKEINKVNLVSLERVESQGLFGRAWSNIQLIVHRFLMEES